MNNGAKIDVNLRPPARQAKGMAAKKYLPVTQKRNILIPVYLWGISVSVRIGKGRREVVHANPPK